MCDNGREIVVARFPAKRGSRPLRIRDYACGITFAARRVLDFEIDARYALNGLDYFEHGKAMAVSAVKRLRGTAGAQLTKRIAMRTRQIAHVDVIANAGAVRRRIIEAENFELRTQSKRGLDRDLYQMRSADARLPSPAPRIGPGDIEVPQYHIIKSVRFGRITQHDFAHQFRPAVR